MRKLDTNVVAVGEATNHHHRVHGDSVAVYDYEDGAGTLMVDAKTEGFSISHEEHNTFAVPKGEYDINLVQEFDPIQQMVVNVAD